MIKNYSKTELENACKNSNSQRDVLRYFQEEVTNNNARLIKELIQEQNVNVMHFSFNAHSKKTNDDMFVKNSTTSRSVIRRRILKDKLLEYKCEMCGCDGNWNGTVIALELDHKDGNGTNNELSNLRFLCPNCHASTETYSGKNMSLKRAANGLLTGKASKKAKRKDLCPCFKINKKDKESKLCVECLRKEQKKNQLSADQLNKLFDEGYSVLQIANMKQVAEGTVRHWIKKEGVLSPSKRHQNNNC